MNWENETKSSQLCILKLGLKLCSVLHYPNYRTGFSLAPGLIKDIWSKLFWQRIGYLTKLIFSWECFPKKKKEDFFTKKKFSPFLFSTSPLHGFRHIYTYILGIQRCHRKFLVLFVLRFLCCTTSSVLIWSSKLEARWGCFTGNIIQAEIQGFKKKKKSNRLLFFIFH